MCRLFTSKAITFRSTREPFKALYGQFLRFGSESAAEEFHTHFPKVHKYANAFHEAHKISQLTSLCVRWAQLSLMFNSSGSSLLLSNVYQIVSFSEQTVGDIPCR
ncbi:hypothetical protein TNCT_360181 [Trichonephila clavata]|uniref:Uncharacterized protein n=1 Tax=Trichonephila clavata TaxID=2740835 RepID=A0A8X6M6N4_TRICU|nr:hypothetical protein TNCT_360181 [Trichonephila clavata]